MNVQQELSQNFVVVPPCVSSSLNDLSSAKQQQEESTPALVHATIIEDTGKSDCKSFSSTHLESRGTVVNGKQTMLSSERLLAVLEHIPLIIKLILVVVFAIISLCVFGALLIYQSSQMIASAKQITHLYEFSVLVSDVVHCLQMQYRQSLLLHRFKLQTSTENLLTYQRVVENSSVATTCNIMENYLVSNHQNISQYSAPQWFFNVTMYMNAMREVEVSFREAALRHARELARQATGSLIAFSVSTFFVTCLSTCIAIIFSKTIVGPWQRILALQEDTVYKFVPKEFLSILNKDKITDLKYGDFFEMELDIMFVDIRNYTGISENLQTKKIFKLLNKYLKNVGPIIRKHNGYIDKYLGDGFVALFLEPGHAVNAAIEIQNSLKDLNISIGPKYPTISVGMGIARGMVAVGLVGESRRMDATIISDNVNIAARLESLTKQYHAVILSSKSIIDTTPNVRENAFRKVGNIAVVGKNQVIEVIEVIPFDDSPKKITCCLFEEAIDHLYDPEKFNVEKAISLFKQILEIDPQDELCQKKLKLAESLLQDSSSWTYCDRLTKK
ncbi:hypothetical protein C9374_011352 [Naegleria lovaniensis]|uniref:Guanylate cyclase domain-containing protein n=1 Tax=Naegleria lovaniensis TaxID=51637 RepID=A0AA88H3Z9_NAELO|nr:uncharacterized protein C9374_011352 [Naegleria lovaniensis]KAG2392627.1 hypothetical protein C9374_011352 [Naegleria lovaniensis]